MSNYRVYFEQINADYYDINAHSKENALAQAKVKWRQDCHPTVTCIEEIGEKGESDA